MSQSLFRQNIKAIMIALTAWFCFSLTDAFTKTLTGEYPAVQLIGMSALTGMILSAGLIFFRHGWRGFLTPNWKLFVIRGLLVIVVSYMVVTALSMITLADFYGIVFMTPFLVTIMSVLFLKEKIGIHRIIALIAGFIGVIVLAGPRMDSIPMGLAYAFIGMVGGSVVTIIIRKIGREPVSELFAFVPCTANALVYVPLMLMPGNFHVPENPWMLTELLALGLTAFMGFLCFSIGFTRATETAVVAPFHYSQMIWGVLFGYLLFGDVPALTTIIGSLIILVAGLYMLWREYVHHKTSHSISTTVSASGAAALPEA